MEELVEELDRFVEQAKAPVAKPVRVPSPTKAQRAELAKLHADLLAAQEEEAAASAVELKKKSRSKKLFK